MLKWLKGFNRRDINKVLRVKTQVRIRIYGFKLDQFKFMKKIEKKWFTDTVVEEWNKLSKYVVSAGIVDI